jgi:hypothetical protein
MFFVVAFLCLLFENGANMFLGNFGTCAAYLLSAQLIVLSWKLSQCFPPKRQYSSTKLLFFSPALQPPCVLASDFQFHDHFTDGRTPWTSAHSFIHSIQLVSRPLPKHRTTQTQNKHIHVPNSHAICGIRTHDSSFRPSEDSTWLRPLSYRDRSNLHYYTKMYTIIKI